MTGARKGRVLADVRPLRESAAFRRLWIGSTLSAVGGALTMFAVPLQVYEITRSPFAVGAIGVAQVVPTVTIGLLGGAVADAVDRRKLVLVASCGSAAVSGGLAAQAFAGLGSVWLLLYLLRKYLFVTYVYYSVVEARGQFFANLKKVSNRASEKKDEKGKESRGWTI